MTVLLLGQVRVLRIEPLSVPIALQVLDRQQLRVDEAVVAYHTFGEDVVVPCVVRARPARRTCCPARQGVKRGVYRGEREEVVYPIAADDARQVGCVAELNDRAEGIADRTAHHAAKHPRTELLVNRHPLPSARMESCPHRHALETPPRDACTRGVPRRPTCLLPDASGNAVAHGSAVGPPRRLQWLGSRRSARHHDHMASLSAP